MKKVTLRATILGFLLVSLIGCAKSPLEPTIIFDEGFLNIPTYDGSGQAVHPDVIYFGSKFKRYHFYMAMTPYPYGNDQLENPCLLVSNDGINFVEPILGMNPLAPPPKGGHNCDVDLLFHAETQELWIYYLETVNPDYQALKLLRSSDLRSWTNTELIRWTYPGDPYPVSPTVAKAEGKYILTYADGRGHKNLSYLESTDGLSWIKSNVKELDISWGEGFQPWHCDLIYDDSCCYLLVNGWFQPTKPFEEQKLYLAKSLNLETWVVSEAPVIDSFDNVPLIYRSSGLIGVEKIIIYFSCRTASGEWRIGYKEANLTDIF